MSVRNAAIASICLMLSLAAPSWGGAKGDSAKWDLWKDPEVAAPEASGKPAPAEAEAAGQDGGSAPAATAASAASVPAGTGSDYLIGAGDVLDISVWKDEALSRTVVVLADGTFSFPLIGETAAVGRTVAQVKDELAKRLTRFIPELELSVEVKQSNSMMIYVIGRVNAPGRQVLNANVNVLQALAMAGGLNPFASRNKIKVLRKEGGQTVSIPFRYNDVVDGDNLEMNIELRRGDVIVVP
ncbi:MAG: polysaccharide export protein [Geobacteraceae bacterium]|nr:polysaccharide export protein [Geobacteraceae bacterium]